MEEMIDAQASLPGGVAAARGREAVAELVRRAHAAGDEVIVAGYRTSEHGAMAIGACSRMWAFRRCAGCGPAGRSMSPSTRPVAASCRRLA